MKAFIPWWAKILVKLILSRVPLHYSFWEKLDLFRHGKMDDPVYALQVFLKHFERMGGSDANAGFVGLELGPGDSLASAVLAKVFGAKKCYLVDTGEYAVRNVDAYRQFIKYLDSQGIRMFGDGNCETIDDILEKYDGVYLTQGLESLRSVPSNNVDLVWSQAVLEHVRLAEFDETLVELRRVLRPGGMASHRIDLKDHLTGALNNLRISSGMWESNWMADSGFYTNRIRYSDMISRFEHAGFVVEVLAVDRWESLPTPREKLSEEFQVLSDDDLSISGFDVILRPKKQIHASNR